MMAGIDQISYFSGMKKSFEDKKRLIDFAKQGSVLEIGFGEGDLLALFPAEFLLLQVLWDI